MWWIIYLAIIILILIILYFKNSFSKFEHLIVKIIEAEENIDYYLGVKNDLLLNICKSINEINKNKVFTGLSFLKKNDYDSFKLDRELSELYSLLKEYLMMNKSFVADDETAAELKDLEINEIEFEASKIFYNDNCKIYNKKVDKFPTNIIARRKNYDYKYLYTFEKEEFFKIMINKKRKKNVLNT